MLPFMLNELLAEIDAHLALRKRQERPLAESTFGRLAVNDGKLLERLRGGGQITVGKAQTIRQWIARDAKSAARQPEQGRAA